MTSPNLLLTVPFPVSHVFCLASVFSRFSRARSAAPRSSLHDGPVNRSAAVFGMAATGIGIPRPGSAVASNANSDQLGGNGSQPFIPQSPLRPAARPASVRFSEK
jgi:hypothetical protein